MTDYSPSSPESTAFHTLAFATKEAAARAYQDLVAGGVLPEQISLFVHASPPHRDDALDHDIDVGGVAGAGAASFAGGVGGFLAGLGLLVVPGFGPLLAVGPIAAALTGVIAGGALGGFAGSLVGAGVSEISAFAAERHLAAGHAIVVVADAAWSKELDEATQRFPDLIANHAA